jgi:hypothetical protein
MRFPSPQAQSLVHPRLPEISNSRRDIPKWSELESQGAPRNLAAARQSSRSEVLLLSLATLFVAVGVGLFTWNAAKLMVQIDRYLLNSIRANFGTQVAPSPMKQLRDHTQLLQINNERAETFTE